MMKELKDYLFNSFVDCYFGRRGPKVISEMTDSQIKLHMRVLGSDDPQYYNFKHVLEERGVRV